MNIGEEFYSYPDDLDQIDLEDQLELFYQKIANRSAAFGGSYDLKFQLEIVDYLFSIPLDYKGFRWTTTFYMYDGAIVNVAGYKESSEEVSEFLMDLLLSMADIVICAYVFLPNGKELFTSPCSSEFWH